MTNFPTGNLDWLKNNLTPNSVEPSSGLKETGWVPGESPDSAHHNWMFSNLGYAAQAARTRSRHRWTVGSDPADDFSSIVAALADASVVNGDVLYVRNTVVLAADLTISKSVEIEFARDAGITGASTFKIVPNATMIKITGGKFIGYGVTIFQCSASGTNFIMENIISNRYTTFDDSAVAANFKANVRGVTLLSPS